MNYSQIMSPRPPLARKVGGHDPPAPMGAPPLRSRVIKQAHALASMPASQKQLLFLQTNRKFITLHITPTSGSFSLCFKIICYFLVLPKLIKSPPMFLIAPLKLHVSFEV